MASDFLINDVPSNRVLDAIHHYTQQDTIYKMRNPHVGRGDEAAYKFKIEYFQNILDSYKRTRDASEKKALTYVKFQIRVTNAKLHPSRYNRFLYSTPVQMAVLLFTRRLKSIAGSSKNLLKIERSEAARYNMDNLQKSLRNAGFFESIEASLKKMMDHRFPKFQIRHSEPGLPNTEFLLHFKRRPGSELYYLETVDTVKRPDPTLPLVDQTRQAPFSTSVLDPMNLKATDLHNLVHDRIIHRRIDGEALWFGLSRNPATPFGEIQQIPFDLAIALSHWPIKENNSEAAHKKLISSLEKNGQATVTLNLGGREERFNLTLKNLANVMVFHDASGQFVDMSRKIDTAESAAVQIMKKSYELAETPVISMGTSRGMRS